MKKYGTTFTLVFLWSLLFASYSFTYIISPTLITDNFYCEIEETEKEEKESSEEKNENKLSENYFAVFSFMFYLNNGSYNFISNNPVTHCGYIRPFSPPPDFSIA
jgi:hypothetical protein